MVVKLEEVSRHGKESILGVAFTEAHLIRQGLFTSEKFSMGNGFN